ncbi:MAG: hypothetical protein KatS3mg097_347 [Candidatus Parcubacteria bacterium]|nr:MAG: hypothetical protein KatS3mg097_347 [Candidatus Parcubacteria bacterium]
MNETKELRWQTFDHIHHPYGDLIWHLLWGAIFGATLILSIINTDFWLMVISLISIIFFFHPHFYEPKLMDIKLSRRGLHINDKFYDWNQFYAFEKFSNDYRTFIFLFPKKLSLGVHIPIEPFFIGEDEVIEFLKEILEEEKDKVPFIDIIYRQFYL